MKNSNWLFYMTIINAVSYVFTAKQVALYAAIFFTGCYSIVRAIERIEEILKQDKQINEIGKN